MKISVSQLKITVQGQVQGVGFRPFVYGLALKHCLKGTVQNIGGIVEINIVGIEPDLRNFVDQLSEDAPPLSKISKLEIQNLEIGNDFSEFKIIASRNEISFSKQIPPDISTCRKCLLELFELSNRRYLYPFINCTDCGPRFTIIENFPYDRVNTSMCEFTMCTECDAEYRDPASRRFHAQPNACSICGPEVTLQLPGALPQYRDEAITSAINEIQSGAILAVKGLGGFHLMGDATNPTVVAAIRALKARDYKPLAMLFKDIPSIRFWCNLSEQEQKLLEGNDSPIVLLKNKEKHSWIENVAPDLNELGVMLPGTGLQHILARACPYPLIATSANSRGLPIITSNLDALEKFSGIGVLYHNRRILSGYDDSIVRAVSSRNQVIRRARGLAPEQLEMPFASNSRVLGVGAQLKSTFCLTDGGYARVSQHLGDVDTIEGVQNYEQTLRLYERLFDIKPDVVIHDLHPNYQSTLFAERISNERSIQRLRVQHHHAHAVAVMAEHKIPNALAVVFDGTGMGDDGNLWGGEFFHCTYTSFERMAHLSNILMPGGEAAIRNPWRMALGFALKQGILSNTSTFSNYVEKLVSQHGLREINTIISQAMSGLNSPATSSCGRLFDAAAAIISPQIKVTYEGQAAMELEALAYTCKCRDRRGHRLEYSIDETGDILIIETSRVIQALAEHLEQGMAKECAAFGFHLTLADIILETLKLLRHKTSQSKVCFSGGVFQNTLLSQLIDRNLCDAGFAVYFPEILPANDGGIAYGQAVIGLAQIEAGTAGNY